MSSEVAHDTGVAPRLPLVVVLRGTDLFSTMIFFHDLLLPVADCAPTLSVISFLYGDPDNISDFLEFFRLFPCVIAFGDGCSWAGLTRDEDGQADIGCACRVVVCIEGSQAEWSPVEGSQEEWSPVDGSQAEWSPVEGAQAEWSPVEGSQAKWSPVEGSQAEWSPVEGSRGRMVACRVVACRGVACGGVAGVGKRDFLLYFML